jgi:hypothetical protein
MSESVTLLVDSLYAEATVCKVALHFIGFYHRFNFDLR